ncbi:MAG TPA: hypothetical protein PKO06_07820 [Candidatus Ozemobacteraceae bacterium]|nr:hypothetical protein [Candidatus Ozemobacteraceae bacterium]
MNTSHRFWVTLGLVAFLNTPACAGLLTAIVPQAGESESKLIITLTDNDIPTPRFIPEEDCWHIDFPKTESRVQLPTQVFDRGPLRLVRLAQVCDVPPIQRLVCHVQTGTRLKVRRVGSECALIFKRGEETRPRLPGPPDENTSGLISPEMTRNEILIQVRKTQTAPLFLELAARAGVELHFRDRPGAAALQLHGTDPLTLMKDLARHLNMSLTLEDGVWWLSRRDNPLLTIPTTGKISASSLAGLTISQALTRLVGDSASRKLLNRLPRKLRDRPLTASTVTDACPRRWVEQLLEAHGVETR